MRRRLTPDGRLKGGGAAIFREAYVDPVVSNRHLADGWRILVAGSFNLNVDAPKRTDMDWIGLGGCDLRR